MDVIATDADRAYEAGLVPKFLGKLDRDDEIGKLERFLSLSGPFPLPPHELRMHVGTRPYASKWLNQGYESSTRVREIFGDEPQGPILDWGCGSGRTLWWLSRLKPWRKRYRGADVDADAIGWLRSQGIASVEVCSATPERGLPYDDASLDGVFGFSVLTHLHPLRHAEWLRELARVLRPGALAYLTFNGDWIEEDAAKREDFREPADLFRRQGWAWIENPGHYKDAAFISHAAIAEAAAPVFEVIELQRAGFRRQDTMLARRR